MIIFMISMIIMLMTNIIVLYICAISLFSLHITCFQEWPCEIMVLSFGVRGFMNVIRRSVVGWMHIGVIYVETYIVVRKVCMDTKENTIQMMYVVLYFCTECELYEFLTYMMYIWTENFSWFTWYFTIL